MYTRGWVICTTTPNYRDIAHSSPNVTGRVRKCTIWHCFSNPLAFQQHSFRNGATYVYQYRSQASAPKFSYLNCRNSVADCSVSAKFDTDFDHMTDNYISVQGRSSKSRSQRDVTCRQIECYKLGMDRLADFKLVIVSENDWQDVERPQITAHRNCHLSSCHCSRYYYYCCCCCCCCCFGKLFDENNNFTVCYFADVSFVRTAVLVFHFQVAPTLNDEA